MENGKDKIKTFIDVQSQWIEKMQEDLKELEKTDPIVVRNHPSILKRIKEAQIAYADAIKLIASQP